MKGWQGWKGWKKIHNLRGGWAVVKVNEWGGIFVRGVAGVETGVPGGLATPVICRPFHP